VKNMTVADEALSSALELASRAPSVHNSQPWQWRVEQHAVHLHADPSRQVPATDPHGRDLVISCGAALHHLLVALPGVGLRGTARRMPDPGDRTHLAFVALAPSPSDQAAEMAALSAAIPRRRTDRRRFGPWPVPAELIGEMMEIADNYGVALHTITDPRTRWRLARAIAAAAAEQEGDPAYAAEIDRWSGRAPDAEDGVPAASAPDPQRASGRMPMRAFARPGLSEPAGGKEPENAAVLLLSTPTDSPLDWLRAGEVTSAVLLTATRDGLASSPLSQPLEIGDTRAYVRERVATTPSAHPQILLRIGWPRAGAEELPPTPRRPLDDVVTITTSS
jgi:nitroreductase